MLYVVVGEVWPLPVVRARFPCDHNLNVLGQALLRYRAEWDSFPTTGKEGDVIASLALVYPKHLRNERYWACPGHETGLLPASAFHVAPEARESACSYYYDSSAPPTAGPAYMLLWDKSPEFHSGRRYVFFADGSVKLLHEEEFERRLARQLQAATTGPSAGPARGEKPKESRRP
jgi:prepilin-type processing-associated H-X9-DG protein